MVEGFFLSFLVDSLANFGDVCVCVWGLGLWVVVFFLFLLSNIVKRRFGLREMFSGLRLLVVVFVLWFAGNARRSYHLWS